VYKQDENRNRNIDRNFRLSMERVHNSRERRNRDLNLTRNIFRQPAIELGRLQTGVLETGDETKGKESVGEEY
jgi:hypothetical protein